MMFPFLFTMGLCAFSHAVKTHALQLTDLLPMEERAQITCLSNGIRTYIQEHEIPPHCGSFRVVIRKTSLEEEIYRYDGAIESWDLVEQFFNDCKERVSIGKEMPSFSKDLNFTSSDFPSLKVFQPQEIAVVAVGDFSSTGMRSLIEQHFGSLNLTQQTFAAEDAIQIGIDPKMSKIALNLSYSNAAQSIRSYSDLREAWKDLLLQELFQQRLECCSRRLEKVWVHPHPQFFYPVKGHALVSHEDCDNLLTFFLLQVEAIRHDGFYEEEFCIAKRKLINQLQYLASRSVSPDNTMLASYFADQFLLGDRCLSLQPFLDASAQLIEEIKIQDLLPHIPPFLLEKNRLIQVAYPMTPCSELLTKDHIEQMIEQIASAASSYRDSENLEDEVGILETKERIVKLRFGDKDRENAPSLIQLATHAAPERFQLAKNLIPVSTDAIAPFYQLPITEREKRLIHSIITTLAEKNILQLAFIKRSVEKKGKKIEHVHPMRFIGYILSHSELRSCLRTVKKSSFKWDAFVAGFSRRMKEEMANNNVYIHIPGFCQQINGNQEVITRLIHKKDWEGLIVEHL